MTSFILSMGLDALFADESVGSSWEMAFKSPPPPFCKGGERNGFPFAKGGKEWVPFCKGGKEWIPFCKEGKEWMSMDRGLPPGMMYLLEEVEGREGRIRRTY